MGRMGGFSEGETDPILGGLQRPGIFNGCGGDRPQTIALRSGSAERWTDVAGRTRRSPHPLARVLPVPHAAAPVSNRSKPVDQISGV
jgi:hypothetical protein